MYSAVVLNSRKKVVIVGFITAGLYEYLYILLQSQDYALLIGSIGLFVVIVTIMYLTRKIKWYEPKTQVEASEEG